MEYLTSLFSNAFKKCQYLVCYKIFLFHINAIILKLKFIFESPDKKCIMGSTKIFNKMFLDHQISIL